NANYHFTLNGFGTVRANGLSHNDIADFYDTGFWTATPTTATMEYSKSLVTANNFATMTEYMSEETSGPLQTPTGQFVPVTLDSHGILTKGTQSAFPLTLDSGVQLVAVKGSQYIWNLTTDHERYFGPLSTVLDNKVQFLRALIDPNVEQ